jgi:hypothetical protein
MMGVLLTGFGLTLDVASVLTKKNRRVTGVCGCRDLNPSMPWNGGRGNHQPLEMGAGFDNGGIVEWN